jgi:hypothetical protein
MVPIYQIIEISLDADGHKANEDRPGPSTRARKPSTASTTSYPAVSREGSRAIGGARR